MQTPRVALLSLLLGASGASALIFEALWFHQASLAFGSSVLASSLVLAAFMAGLALGSALCARYADRLRSPLVAYALVELLIACSGVLLVMGLSRIGATLAPLAGQSWLLQPLRFIAAFLLLLVPSTAMGITFPLVMRVLSARADRFGSALGLLYGVNTLGAVGGVLVTELWLLELLGVQRCAGVAAALNLFAAALAVLCNRGIAGASDSVVAFPAQTPVGGIRLLVAAFLSGLALLALEVVWLRFLMLFLNDTPLAFAIVLAAVLLGIALGGLLASLWLRRAPQADRFAALIAYGAGLLGLLGYRLYPFFLERYLSFDQPALSIFAIAAPLVVPAAIGSGALFTVLGAAIRRKTASDATAAGRLSWVNTLGACAGSLLGGLLLLPHLGMERSFFLLFALYGLIGLLLGSARELRAAVRHSAFFGFALALAFFPFGEVRATYIKRSAGGWMRAGDSLIEVREAQSSTIAHIRHALFGVPIFDQLATNAYSMSVNDFAARRYMGLFVYLPAAIHPKLQSALLVGYGLGNTAEALTRTHELTRIDVVDTSRDMLELSRKVQPRRTPEPLDDRRVHVRIEDGRYFLQATTQRFDLITGEPPPPILAGVSNLYSREYFELMHDRLSQGGIATYWLPMMNLSAAAGLSIVKAFCGAFDDCSLWHGSARNFMLMGTRGAGASTVTAERFARQFHDPGLRDELSTVGLEGPAQLGTLFIGDAQYLKNLTEHVEGLSDDKPKLMQKAGQRKERDALIWQWRDTKAARERFAKSSLIARLFPEATRLETLRQFENQRLVNDLLFPEETPVRQTAVLHQVLFGTRLRFPVLLLLGSNPDVQRALAQLPLAQRDKPEWLPHRTAGLLADRNFKAALPLLERTPDELLVLPDLRTYVGYAIAQGK